MSEDGSERRRSPDVELTAEAPYVTLMWPSICPWSGLQTIVQKYVYVPPTVKLTVTVNHLPNGMGAGRLHPFFTLTGAGPDIVNRLAGERQRSFACVVVQGLGGVVVD